MDAIYPINYLDLNNLHVNRTQVMEIKCKDLTCICNITTYYDQLYYNLPTYSIREEYIMSLRDDSALYSDYGTEPIKTSLTNYARKLNPEIGEITHKDYNTNYYLLLHTLHSSIHFKDMVQIAYITEYVDIDLNYTGSDDTLLNSFISDQLRVFNKLIDLIYIINTKLQIDCINKKDHTDRLFQCNTNPYKIIFLSNRNQSPNYFLFHNTASSPIPLSFPFSSILVEMPMYSENSLFPNFYIYYRKYNEVYSENWIKYKYYDIYSIYRTFNYLMITQV